MKTLSQLFAPGARHAIPLMLFLLGGFVAPLLAVVAYSFVPTRTFSLWQGRTLANYVEIFTVIELHLASSGRSAWPPLTVLILALVCYPVAFGMARVFGS